MRVGKTIIPLFLLLLFSSLRLHAQTQPQPLLKEGSDFTPRYVRFVPAYDPDNTMTISSQPQVDSLLLQRGVNLNAVMAYRIDSIVLDSTTTAVYSEAHNGSPTEPHIITRGLAIKTNLLYLAALMINMEGEYYFNSKLSLNLEGQYAWWKNSQQHRYYRIATVSPEFRYWFHRKSMDQGHFGGVYVAAGIYEFMRNAQQGIQGEFFVAAGLSYGYMMPVSRALNLEFSLGVGYMMTEFRQYHYDAGCYVYDLTKRSSYFGVTKAKVSLVFPLGRGRSK